MNWGHGLMKLCHRFAWASYSACLWELVLSGMDWRAAPSIITAASVTVTFWNVRIALLPTSLGWWLSGNNGGRWELAKLSFDRYARQEPSQHWKDMALLSVRIWRALNSTRKFYCQEMKPGGKSWGIFSRRFWNYVLLDKDVVIPSRALTAEGNHILCICVMFPCIR